MDPFSGLIKDGFVWGRGALDMKGEAIAQLMAMVILKRAHVPLKRDIIFLATSDEEIGAGVGAAIGLLSRGGDVRLEPGTSVEMVIQRSVPLDGTRLPRS